MTQPRRQDELDFYAALRARAAERPSLAYGLSSWGGRSVAVEEFTRLGIPEKRAFYLLEKWDAKGWIDCGMWVWAGWFTDKAPEVLTP